MHIEDQLQGKLAKLEKAFDTLRAAQKEKLDKPENTLEFLHEHLIILYNMLRKWSEYTNLLKMPASVIRDILTQKQKKNEKYKILKKQSTENELHTIKGEDEDAEHNDSDLQSNDERQTSESEDE